MIIKKIKLDNFQKHDHLEIDLVNGINVIVGASGIGKTCIIRALRWIFNDITGDHLRKEGTKKTIVTIELEGGISVSRIRTDSINRYLLVTGNTEKQFDACGKKLPEEIANIFNLPILKVEKEELLLNVHTQLDAPFLLSQSGTYRSKILNVLTGNDTIDSVLKSYNKDLLDISKTDRTIKEELETKTNSVNELKKEQVSLVDVIDKYKERYNDLKEKQEKLDKIRKLFIALEENNIAMGYIEEHLDKIPEIDLHSFIEIAEKIGQIKKIKSELFKNDTGILIARTKNLELTVEIEKLKQKYNELIEQMPNIVCPKCNYEFKEKDKI